MKRIMKCPTTGKYTMHEVSPWSGEQTVRVGPAKYSPEDKYAKYRRAYKEQA